MLKKVVENAVIPMVTLEVASLGEKISFGVSYYARSQDEFNTKIEDMVADKITVAELVAWLVKDWEVEYAMTVDDLNLLEKQRPGMLQLIIAGWPKAMQSELVKN